MAISFLVFEINRDIGRKRQFSYPLYLTCTIPWNPFEFSPKILTQRVRGRKLLEVQNYCRKVQPCGYRAPTLQTTDDRQTAIAINRT